MQQEPDVLLNTWPMSWPNEKNFRKGLFKKINKGGELLTRTHEERIQEAVEKELISKKDGEQLHELWMATREAIRVDHFTNKELARG